MRYKYEHCETVWYCDDAHVEGDVCLVCGEKVVPVPVNEEPIEKEKK